MKHNFLFMVALSMGSFWGAYAQTTGTSGDCSFTIDADGNMIVKPTVEGAEDAELPYYSSMVSPEWLTYKTDIKTVVFETGVTPQSFSSMFNGCTNLVSVDMSKCNPSKEGKIYTDYMFNSCSKLESVALPPCKDGQKVVNMRGMFAKCSELTAVDLSVMNLDGSELKNLSYIFNACSKLNNVVWPADFTTPVLTDMSFAFSNCYKLDSMDIARFASPEITTMKSAFTNTAVRYLDFSNYDMGKVTDISRLLLGVPRIKTLVLPAVFVHEGMTTDYFIGGKSEKFPLENVEIWVPEGADQTALIAALEACKNDASGTVYLNDYTIKTISTTGIEAIENNVKVNSAIFNLAGSPVKQMTQGSIYVTNGKRVMVR